MDCLCVALMSSVEEAFSSVFVVAEEAAALASFPSAMDCLLSRESDVEETVTLRKEVSCWTARVVVAVAAEVVVSVVALHGVVLVASTTATVAE
jgi:hypothetical protein